MTAATVTPAEAAAVLRTRDTLGLPLGPGQPPALLQALGERTDWEDLRISVSRCSRSSRRCSSTRGCTTCRASSVRWSATCATPTPTSASPPADFRRMGPLLQAGRALGSCPRPPHLPTRTAGAACPCTAGGTDRRARRSGRDPDRLVVARPRRLPAHLGAGQHRHGVHVADIDLVESDAAPTCWPTPGHRGRPAIAVHVDRLRPFGRHPPDGNRGSPPPSRLLGGGPRGGFGVHSEMFTDGLMGLHRPARSPTRRRVCTTALGHDVREGTPSCTAGSTTTATSPSAGASS